MYTDARTPAEMYYLLINYLFFKTFQSRHIKTNVSDLSDRVISNKNRTDNSQGRMRISNTIKKTTQDDRQNDSYLCQPSYGGDTTIKKGGNSILIDWNAITQNKKGRQLQIKITMQ